MKKIIKLLSVTLVALLLVVCFASCGEKAITNLPETTDNYRSYYQIFPYSFADSDSDGVGDINGIIAKLDYIANMNFDGIWLTPVHQSPSYHKYDVVDYKSIDKKFGTLEDYDRLVEECHKRGMTILLDLVFNHTSDQNDWFEACYLARKNNETWDKYYSFYNFEQGSVRSGWSNYEGSWIYESQFNAGMPDLNLQNVLDEPEGYLATELKDIMKFWLVDHKVDGFRLDAVTSYFTGNRPKNTQFLSWLNTTAKELKPDCYIVGEGAWSGTAENAAYQTSGIDSIFMFHHGYTATNSISFATRLEKASYLSSIDQSNISFVSGGIPALFISNHDVARAYGVMVASEDDISNIKVGYGLMSMCAGTTFWYYGDEIAMRTFPNAAGKDIDENKRQPIPWGDNYTCIPVKGSTNVPFDRKYPLGLVKDNLKDNSSIIAYITRANALRRAFPQIARNYGEQVYLNDDETLAVVKKGEGKDAIYIVVNLAQNYQKTFDVSVLGVNVKLAGTLSVDKMPTLKGNTLTMPHQTFAILQQG